MSDAVLLVAVRVRRLEVREGNQLTEIPYTVTVTCNLLFLIFGNYMKQQMLKTDKLHEHTE